MNHAVSTKFSQEELDLLEDKIEFDDDTGRFYVMDYEQLSLGQFYSSFRGMYYQRCVEESNSCYEYGRYVCRSSLLFLSRFLQ